MIDHMISALPDYDHYLRLFQEDEPLKASIVKVYQDLMDFLRIATRIFFRKSSMYQCIIKSEHSCTAYYLTFDSIQNRDR